MRARWFVVLVGMVIGCGGSYPAPQQPVPAAAPGAAASTAEAAHGKGRREREIDITRAALPFKVLRSKGGTELDTDAFYGELAQAAAICVGEAHPNPHHHWAQLTMLQELSKRRSGAPMALGMEMFQQPFQGVLDDYAAGRIDQPALLARTGWAERWGYDFALYQPMVRMAVEHRMALLALNVAQELRKKVSAKGVAGLSAAERAQLPELNLEDAEHRAWFDGVMAEMGGVAAHGHGHETGGKTDKESAQRAERIYLAQVLWDESMAEIAARWLSGTPGGQVVILAGNGHCHQSAIVRRMRRRGAARVVSVRPIIDDGQGNVAAELAQPTTDYLFVMSIPQHATGGSTP